MNYFKKFLVSIKNTVLLIYGLISIVVNLNAIGILLINTTFYIVLFSISVVIFIIVLIFNFFIRDSLRQLLHTIDRLDDDAKTEILRHLNNSQSHSPDANIDTMSHIPPTMRHGNQLIEIIA